MKKNVLLSAVFGSLFVFGTACRNAAKGTEAGTEAVYTANTAVRNQGQIGFCWAYAAVAMIEADFKKRTGRDIDLSEEAIGFFHFAEQIKGNMDFNLKNNSTDFNIKQGGFILNEGARGAFALIERWGLMPESQWTEKFDSNVDASMSAIQTKFQELQKQIQGKQNAVQLNQIFSLLTSSAFKSMPPVDGFNNGSGMMNAVKYARDVIGFKASNFDEVFVNKYTNINQIEGILERVKRTLAAGNVVGIEISMPAASAANRLTANVFRGMGAAFELAGAHAMVITDFRNQGGTFGPAADVNAEVNKKLEKGFQFRLKNSWGSSSGLNEFGQTVASGYYDMDLEYILEVLLSEYPAKKGSQPSPGFVAFTFPKG